jgi:hypothetical protein
MNLIVDGSPFVDVNEESQDNNVHLLVSPRSRGISALAKMLRRTLEAGSSDSKPINNDQQKLA